MIMMIIVIIIMMMMMTIIKILDFSYVALIPICIT